MLKQCEAGCVNCRFCSFCNLVDDDGYVFKTVEELREYFNSLIKEDKENE